MTNPPAPHSQVHPIVGFTRQRARLEALELGVPAAADRSQVGAISTAAWLAHTTLADRPEVAARVRLARAFDEDHCHTQPGRPRVTTRSPTRR